MRLQIHVLLISSLLAWQTADSFAQTDTDFFSRSEIPAAGEGTIQPYYDPFTGDVLLSIGEDIGILAFGVPSTVDDPVDVANLQASFDAINRDALIEDGIEGAIFIDESPNGLVFLGGGAIVGSQALPTGVFNLGPIYEILPFPSPVVLNSPLLTVDASDAQSFDASISGLSIQAQLDFELAAQDYYSSLPTGLFAAVQGFGVDTQVTPVLFLRPELAIAVPEPCSALMFPVLGAGILMRRRRK